MRLSDFALCVRRDTQGTASPVARPEGFTDATSVPSLHREMFLLAPGSAGAGQFPTGFAYLRDVAPDILQDMRYAGPDNFIGRPVPGYEAAEYILQAAIAETLKRVQADLRPQGLGLKV